MFTRISMAAIAAAALSSTLSVSAASAYSYGSGPECNINERYDARIQGCVRVSGGRDYWNDDYQSRRGRIGPWTGYAR